MADRFGVQCIVVGIDTWYDAETGKYHVNQYTGDESRTRVTQWETLDWVEEVQKRGAGEIDYINGFLLRRARAHGIAVQENTRLFEMVKRKESEYERIGTGLPRPW